MQAISGSSSTHTYAIRVDRNRDSNCVCLSHVCLQVNTPEREREREGEKQKDTWGRNKAGCVLRSDCPFRPGVTRTWRCFSCGQPGHIARNCRSGNGHGASTQGSGRPAQQWSPNIIVVATVKKNKFISLYISEVLLLDFADTY